MLNSSNNNFSNYQVAAYERLSKEDDGCDESSSIASQKMIIESFAKFNNFTIIKHYFDDGFTGSNFKRPGFLALKEDIEAGLINCVIVKDLSRLGRQLYETGNYIEEYFLSKQVRFIAINDGYDSEIGDAMLGIRLSVNDLYLRDTSKKIRTTFDVKRKKGDYIGSLAKYGYQKDPNNPKRLIPDHEVAWVVVLIFKWLASGVGTSVIAQRLTERKIAIPSIYKQEHRLSKQESLNEGKGIWRPQTVRSIGSDQMYLGHMVQGRWKKLSYNSKKLIELPEAKWIIVKNTHEPLVSKELFEQAQLTLNKAKKYRARKEKQYLLQGLLKCHECQHNISIYQKKNKYSVSLTTECNYYSKYSKYHLCTSHRLNYRLLEAEILAFLKNIGTKIVENYDIELLVDKCLALKSTGKNQLQAHLKQLESEIKKTQNILTRLYEDRLNEVISLNQYTLMAQKYEQQLSVIENKLQEVKKLLNKIDGHDQNEKRKQCEDLVIRFMKFEIVSHELMYQLIEKIEIDQDKNVEVFFKANLQKYLD